MDRARDWLGGLGFRQRIFIAAVTGALATTAFAPLSLVPVLIPALVVLLWLSAGARRTGEAFWLGLSFGLGHFLSGLYWITEAFYVIGGPAAVAAWPAVAGLSLYMACYPAAVAACTKRWLLRRPGVVTLWDVAGFAALWTLAEWLRGWMFTGFPWNPIGNVWTVSDAMIQPAALFGVYGLSFATVLAAGAPAVRLRGRWNGIVLTAGIVAVMWAGGAWRLSTTAPDDAATGRETVTLRLVQPSIPQRLKWIPDLRAGHVHDQVAMSRAGSTPALVVWAETAIPFYVNGDAALQDELARAVPAGGYLIAGGLRREGEQRYNSIFAIGDTGDVADTYDKVHLVPFGEYMPFADLLPFGKLTAGTVDFTSGNRFAPMSLPNAPAFQPLICFEAIFPGGVVAGDAPRPAWLLNLTNDAWYGDSAGPHQHFEIVRLRAVEEGLPIVRVANTGISGIIDAYGRVTGRLDLGVRGVFDAVLPPRSASTVFSRTGNSLVLILVLVVIVMTVTVTRRHPV